VEHAVLELGLDLRRVGIARQAEGAQELPVAPLDAVPGLSWDSFSKERSPSTVRTPFSTRSLSSSSLKPGTSMLKASRSAVSEMSTGGAHEAETPSSVRLRVPKASLRSRLNWFWKAWFPRGSFVRINMACVPPWIGSGSARIAMANIVSDSIVVKSCSCVILVL
jgi:hypothetical protein